MNEKKSRFAADRPEVRIFPLLLAGREIRGAIRRIRPYFPTVQLKKLRALTLPFLLILCGFAPAWGARHTVCPDCPLDSPKQAVEMAAAGDTIYIRAGVYYEKGIEVTKELHLIGEEEAVIDGRGEGEILTLFADGSTVRGLHLRNVGVSYVDDWAALRLSGCDGCRVEDNVLENTFFGIYLQGSNDCTVRNNEITGQAEEEAASGNAIHLWKCKRARITGNYVTGHRDGIYFEFVDDSEIRDNLSEYNLRYGLHFMFSNRDLYQGNTFRSNGVGVAVMFSNHIRMIGNTFTHNWGGASYGLLLKEISDGELAHNRFLQNTKGIYAEGANRLRVHHNEFRENGWALHIQGNCIDNRFERNNFFANTFEVTTNTSRNLNTYTHNYWSQYRGADFDRDGAGDAPYRPVSLHALIISKVPVSSLLLHSFLMDALNYAERLLPSLTPETLVDKYPLMKPVPDDHH